MRHISSATALDNLKREAKRWLRALDSGDAEARARFELAAGKAADHPTLRDVQHAIAREFGVSGWNELRDRIANHSQNVAQPEPTPASEETVDWFLENACPDHHVRGAPDHIMAQHTAMHVLSKHPDIARRNLFTAVVCGEVERVAEILRATPDAANARRGTDGAERARAGGDGDRFKKRVGAITWEPILFLAFTRLSLPAANDNALEIARLLLDHGADPNAFFMAGSSKYTPLTGVAGQGEENRPPHPQRDALAALLLDRGAEPYDIQVVYNIGFEYARGDVLWFLKLIYARAVQIGRKSDWDDPEWRMLNMGGYGCGARWFLDLAIRHNNLVLAEWCLVHGASATAPPARDRRFSQNTLLEEAVRAGLMDMAQLLIRHGAVADHIEFKGDAGFIAACMRLDRVNAIRHLNKKKRLLHVCKPMMLAALHDNASVVELMLDLGMSPDITDPENGKQVALHVAAYAGSVRVVELLVKRGATIDVFDAQHGGTPLWFAMYGNQHRVVEVLSAVSCDIWTLSLTGNVARLREVLATHPELARAGEKSGETALFYLPGDSALAVEIVQLFLALGTDTRVKNSDGFTAADLAEKRGLVDAATLLRAGQQSD